METLIKGSEIVLGYENGKPLSSKPFSFSFPRNTLIGLVGRNGSGKTTLLRSFLGEPVLLSGIIEGVTDKVAFVPQEHVYPPHLRLNEMLRLAFLPKAGV